MSGVETKVIVSPVRETNLEVVGNTVTVLSTTGESRITEFNVGIVGPTGPSGGAENTLRYSQIGASSSWTINHGLGYFPNVQIFDEDGTQMFTDFTHVDANTLVIHFPFPLSGTAILS